MSFSIWTKEFLFTDISKKSSDFSYFITTSKTGIMSIVSDKKILFSLDLNKKMHKTYFHREKIITGDIGIIPLEGSLFKVYPDESNLEENLGIDDFEKEKFEEITTPIRVLADTEPFSFWFKPNYFFNGNKDYSIVKVINGNNRFISEKNVKKEIPKNALDNTGIDIVGKKYLNNKLLNYKQYQL